VTFDPVPLCIICVRLGPSTPGVYVRARVFDPLKSGCYRQASKNKRVSSAYYTMEKVSPQRRGGRSWRSPIYLTYFLLKIYSFFVFIMAWVDSFLEKKIMVMDSLFY
jgi:hypothetical protein